MAHERDTAGPVAEESPAPTAEEATNEVRAPWLAPRRWKPGQSGNPKGRPSCF